MGYLIPIIALFFLLWLLVIRPQRRRQLQQLEMQNELHVGDEVLTVEIAPEIRVRLDRRAVAAVVRPDVVDADVQEAPEIERADG